MSVAKTLANLNGKRVLKLVTGVHTVESIDEMREDCLLYTSDAADE